MTEYKEDPKLKSFLEEQGYDNVTFTEKYGYVALNQYLFTVGIIQGLDWYGINQRWCYENRREAIKSFEMWLKDLTDDPPGNWGVRKGRKGDYRNPNYVKDF